MKNNKLRQNHPDIAAEWNLDYILRVHRLLTNQK